MERYMILLKPGGKCRLIPCDKDGTLTLQAMQVLVDGPIETAASILGPCWAREPVDSIKLILNEEASSGGSRSTKMPPTCMPTAAGT